MLTQAASPIPPQKNKRPADELRSVMNGAMTGFGTLGPGGSGTCRSSPG